MTPGHRHDTSPSRPATGSGRSQLSAGTADDLATTTFTGHASRSRPGTCAQVLLSSSVVHSASARLWRMEAHFRSDDMTASGHALFGNGDQMAVGNSIDPTAPVLGSCL